MEAPQPQKTTRRPQPAPLVSLTAGSSSVCPSPAASVSLLPEISPDLTPIPQTPNGLRAQLQHLLPRHAVFHVRLQVHDISSVPLISGEFAVRWRFKNAYSVAGTRGFLGLGGKKQRNSSRSRSRQRKASGNETSPREFPITTSEDSFTSGHASPESVSTDDHPSIPSVVVSANSPPLSSPDSMSPTSMSPSATPLPSSFSIQSVQSASRIPTLADLSSLRINGLPSQPNIKAASSPSLLTNPPLDGYSSPRGRTPFGQLVDHKVSWEHTIDIAVKMDVERDTLNLLPSEVKLEVMQRVLPNDPSSPQRPRLGVIRLNLAEYATPAPITQHYLLQKSKTNATLRLTISLQQISGEQSFVAPPLSRSGVLNGVRGVLDSDVLRMRPRLDGLESAVRGMQRGMDIGTISSPGLPPVPPGLSGLGLLSEFGVSLPSLPGAGSSRTCVVLDSPPRSRSRQSQKKPTDSQATMKLAPSPMTARTPSSSSAKSTSTARASAGGWGKHDRINGQSVSLDALMGLAYGPQATETLIEAIFNPVATIDPSKQGPFTYLVDPPRKSSRAAAPSHPPSSNTKPADDPANVAADDAGNPSVGSTNTTSPVSDSSRASSPPESPHEHGDSASFYSTEDGSSASESLHSHHTHQSQTSRHSHRSQQSSSTRSSLGIGLGKSTSSARIPKLPPPEPPSPAEPNGRLKGWWKRIHGPPPTHVDSLVQKPLPATPESRGDRVAE